MAVGVAAVTFLLYSILTRGLLYIENYKTLPIWVVKACSFMERENYKPVTIQIGKALQFSMYFVVPLRGRNNSRISGSQQDYLVGKSGSPQIYLVVIWPRFKQNNMTNTTYSQILW